MKPPAFIPGKNTKQYELLRRLLSGEQVDPFIALQEINLGTIHARASELRRMGWPVRTKTVPHPNPRLATRNEKVTVYFIDQHFREWIAANPTADPKSYPFKEGRGKFAEE